MNFLFQRRFIALVRWVSFFIYDMSVSMIPNDKNGRRKKQKKPKKNRTHKKTTISFLTGYFLAFAAFSFRNWIDSLRMEGSRMKSAGRGQFGAGTRRSLLFFLFSFLFSLSYYGHGFFFLFFLSFFLIYLLSHSLIITFQ